jgi:MarR family transcriptional regulator, 2-MHQ and catechol-resistance regulon repressor
MKSALSRDAIALTNAVAELVRVYQFRDRDQICCHDISVTQCYALEALVQHGPMRSTALAARLYLGKSTTSRVVTTLVRKRYVEQRSDPADGRAVTLRVTGAGRALYERINDDLVEQQKALLADLDPDLRAGVTRVISRLARAADARFRNGGSVGACACPPQDSENPAATTSAKQRKA